MKKKIEKNEKDLKLQEAINQLNKKYKKDVIAKGINSIERIPTGIISLDKLTNGGVPRSRWTMIFGDKSAGKTSLCTQLAGNIIRQGGKVALIDAEASFDPEYAKTLGLDVNNLIYNKPDTLEEGATIIQKLAPFVDMVIYDSIVSVSPAAEMERELEQETRAIIPRKLSQFFRIVTPVVGKSKAAIILVNQVRVDLNRYGMKSYPGGNALGHACGFIMQLWRGSKADAPTNKVNGKDVVNGFKIFAKAAKSKISDTEGQTVSFNYYYKGEHFRPLDDLFQMAELFKVIEKSGAWYNYGEDKFQGQQGFINFMKANPSAVKEIKKAVIEAKL